MWKRDEADKRTSGSSDSLREQVPAVGKPSDRVVMDLGKSVVIKGELSASEDLTLYGRMEGSITLPGHTLTIGPHAEIKAAVTAKSVVIQGAITGNVTAREKIEIQTTGSVLGDVVSPRLAIADGGSLTGKVQMPDSRSNRPSASVQ
jgi:cytoskeletal protein CcmA (bactofilin family)